MPDVIKLLPDHVANQIAAGEVVQRPASVVKELLENAIDAKATVIQLIVKEAGRNLIQVIDNGLGMSLTDARMAFERHATSKITRTEDIFNILTKGFRGEALASIAAVAQVELKTKKSNEEVGSQLIIEANEVKKQEAVVCPDGSNFVVKNLFYNVPARRKFLKSNHVEFRHIIDEFHRVALTHPDLEFQLFHDDKEIFKLKKAHLGERIVSIFGKKMQPNLVPIEESLDWISIKGYIGKPESAKKSRGEQFFFVNNRYFRSPYFNKSVIDAFEGLLQNGYHPAYFIYIEINPEMIDVNIHPSKTEIKFEREHDLYALLLSTLKRAIGVYNVSPSLDFEQEVEWQGNLQKNSVITAPKIHVNPNFNPFETGSYTQASYPEKVQVTELYSQNFQSENLKSEPLFEEKNLPLRLQNGLWLIEKEEKIWVLNPFRMHQTVLQEAFTKKNTLQTASQQLLFPIEVPISEKDKVILKSIDNHLFELGFELDFESEFLTLQAIPTDLEEANIHQLFDEILGQTQEFSKAEFVKFYTQTLVQVSAKTKNNWQDTQEILSLLQEFNALGNPKYSPNKKLNYSFLELNTIESQLL